MLRRTSVLAACTSVLLAAAPAAAADFSLSYIGQQSFARGTLGAGIGGLSGIDYDPVTNRYVAISDDRSQVEPARFYGVDLALTSTAFTGVSFTAPTTLRRPDGSAYPAASIDPESIRFVGNGRIAYTSEGDASAGIIPFVREANLDGSFVRDLTVPAYYLPSPGYGIRNNLAFESLTLSNDGASYVTATENALAQDGTAGSLTTGSPSRILFMDRISGLPTAEYVYQVDPGAISVGLVELLGLADDRYLALERTFNGVNFSAKLFEIALGGATDVLGISALAGQSYTSVSKTLLFDLATLGIPLDNVEGVTFGETLDNGHRSLILVADDNFSNSQFTQFIAFDVAAVPENSTWALLIGGLGMAGASLRRSRRREIAALA